jgi:hypothetical protein
LSLWSIRAWRGTQPGPAGPATRLSRQLNRSSALLSSGSRTGNGAVPSP